LETIGEGNFHVFEPTRLERGSVEGIRVRNIESYMALERYKPWWMRPTFGGTEFAFEFETQFLFWRTTDGHCGVAVPLVSGNLRAFFKSKNGKLVLEWTGNADACPEGRAALLYTMVGDDPLEVCEAAMVDVAHAMGQFQLRITKPEPAFVDYLGWCTWDAFYHDVSAEKVLDGIDSFLERDIPIRYVVLDDGWQTVNPENKKLLAFTPDKDKFPDGLLPVVAEAKMEMGIDFFGVWHTLQGYWNGVDPAGPLGQRYRTVPSADGTRSMIHPDDVGRFFMDFHDRLRHSGVDFVKVDNQSSLEKFVPEPAGSVEAMRAYQHALQGSAMLHFRGGLIHCMCNSSDVAYHMLGTNLWRNSDDFFPKQPESHQDQCPQQSVEQQLRPPGLGHVPESSRARRLPCRRPCHQRWSRLCQRPARRAERGRPAAALRRSGHALPLSPSRLARARLHHHQLPGRGPAAQDRQHLRAG
jgi:raffinose synthase